MIKFIDNIVNNICDISEIENSIITGDNVEVMEKFPDNSIRLVVTSPPYDNYVNGKVLMDDKNRIRDFDGYSWDFEKVAKQLYRVIVKGGTLVWVVSDKVIEGDETGSSFRQALFFKSLGFKMRTLIYKKRNFTNPHPNCYHKVFEFMFMFSKGKQEVFNPIFDRKNICAGESNWGENSIREKSGEFKYRPKAIVKDFGKRHDVWEYATGYGNSSKEKDLFKNFPAVFPEKLAQDCIISWSNPGDIVLDPFGGSGTVAKMCLLNKRRFIHIDCSRNYNLKALERLCFFESQTDFLEKDFETRITKPNQYQPQQIALDV